MNGTPSISRQQLIYRIHLGASSLLFLSLLPFFQFQFNPDAAAYIAIAQHYANGNWSSAFSSYWSPLISWLLVPFVKTGVEPILGFKLISFASALFLSHSAIKLFPPFPDRLWLQVAIRLTVFIPCMMHGLCSNTPDVLSAALVLYTFQTVQSLWNNPQVSFKQIGLGAMAAAFCYYAKHYNLYALSAMAAIGLCVAIFHSTERAAKVALLLKTYALFILCCLPWAFISQQLTGDFTFSSAGAFNMSMLQYPTMPQPGSVGDSLLPLPYHQFIYSSIENPLSYHIPSWSPFTQPNQLLDFGIRVVLKNGYHLVTFFPLLLALFILTMVWLRYTKQQISTPPAILLIALLVYPAGYLLLVVEYRYLMLCEVIATLWLFQMLTQINRPKLHFTVAFLCILFGLYETITYPHKGQELYQWSQQIATKENLAGQKWMSSSGLWNKSVSMAYFTKSTYADALKPEVLKKYESALKQRGINYYLCEQNQLHLIGINFNIVAELNGLSFIKLQLQE